MNIKITEQLKKELPYTCKYAELYGEKRNDGSYNVELISTFETPAKYKHTPELLYKECIESGKKWDEIVSPISNTMIL